MTDATPNNDTAPAADTAPKQPAQAEPEPKVIVKEPDADAINQIVEQRVKDAEAAMRQRIAESISGGTKKDDLDDYQKAFLKDGKAFTAGLYNEIKKEVKREIQEESEQLAIENKAAAKALGPALQKFPALQNVPNEIHAELQKVQDKEPNLSIEAQWEQAVANTVKRLGFKEPDADSDSDAFLPPTSLQGATGARGKENADLDYIKQQRAQFAALRIRKQN